jgi:hypothetical protein
MTTACSNNYGYTGTYFGFTENDKGIPKGIILTTDAFELTEANAALHTQLLAKIKALQAFPIKFETLAKNHEDKADVTLVSRRRINMLPEKRRYEIMLPANDCMAKQLVNFRGFIGGVVFIYDKSGTTILEYYKLETDKIKGIPLDYCYVKGIDVPLPDGSEVPMVSVQFDLEDESDMVIDGFPVVYDKRWNKINGLTPVTLIQYSTASATSAVIDVYSTCATGCNKPIPSLVTDDFTITGTGSITNAVESATVPGRYTITGTTLTTNDIISLVTPTSLSLVYNPVIATTNATLTISA